MAKTREDYIADGEGFSTDNVTSQLEYHDVLIHRDSEGLSKAGFGPRLNSQFSELKAQHQSLKKSYESQFGKKVGQTKGFKGTVKEAKKWRRRAISIGRSNLDDEGALAEIDAMSAPTSGRDERLAQQISRLQEFSNQYEEAFREGGGDDEFFNQGAKLAEALTGGSAGKRLAKKDILSAHDDLDEVEGKIWEILKKINSAGKAFHLDREDPERASQYNLELLYGRKEAPKKPEPKAEEKPKATT